jgi:DNA-directed RNA polymerase specialized sigma24 family protein
MLGSQEEAEDAVQHTFLAAHRELVAHDRPIHLRAWLFTIARNRCLSLLRARREHAELDVVEPSTEGLAATVARREDVRELLGDIARLSERQRAALLLSELGHEQERSQRLRQVRFAEGAHEPRWRREWNRHRNWDGHGDQHGDGNRNEHWYGYGH